MLVKLLFYIIIEIYVFNVQNIGSVVAHKNII